MPKYKRLQCPCSLGFSLRAFLTACGGHVCLKQESTFTTGTWVNTAENPAVISRSFRQNSTGKMTLTGRATSAIMLLRC